VEAIVRDRRAVRAIRGLGRRGRYVEALVSVHDQVFGDDQADLAKVLLAGIACRPGAAAAVVAWSGQIPIAGARVEFHHGSDFASLWDGGTLPAWRGRGVFRSLVAYRAV
jgi:hypothetical protein